jgi:hypothetical protein
LNFGQLDYYSFAPSRPVILTKGMPKNRNHVSWEYILYVSLLNPFDMSVNLITREALPSLEQAKESARVAALLSLSNMNDIASGM